MKFLLTTTTGIAALVAGAGIAMAEDQSAASTSSSMGAETTCADIANLGEDEAERALYFLAGLHHGQDSSGMSGASGMSSDSAAAMPSTDTGSSSSDAASSSAASSTSTDGGVPSNDTASSAVPGAQSQDSAGMAESPASPLPGDSSESAMAPADSSAGSASSSETAASDVPSDPMGNQSGDASQDTAGAVPGIESDTGDDSMQDLAEADSGIDQTTTAGVSGTASGSFTADGFYDIPVDMVMADCRTSPDASISEVLGKHNSK